MDDRRKTERFPTSFYVFWGETEECLRSGKVTSLSAGGCFIQTRAPVAKGDLIFIRLPRPTEGWLLLRGEVVYYLQKAGPGVRFVELKDEDRSVLAQLIEHYREDRTAH